MRMRYATATILALLTLLAAAPPDAAAKAGGWTRVYTKPQPAFYDIEMFDESSGLALLGSGILRTDDGGRTWTEPQAVATRTYGDIGYADKLHAWAVGPSGLIQYTSDGGSTWNAQQSGTKLDLRRITIIDSKAAWIVGSGLGSGDPDLIPPSVVLRTIDAGETWKQMQIGGYATFLDIAFTDDETGWLLASACAPGQRYAQCDPYQRQELLRTSDGGRTWNGVSMPTGVGIERMQWLDRDHGYATSWIMTEPPDSGEFFLFATDDGGASWDAIEAAPHGVGILRFTSTEDGWIAANSCGEFSCENAIWHTSDGGASWTAVPGDFNVAETFDVTADAIVTSGYRLGEIGSDLFRYAFAANAWERAATPTADGFGQVAFGSDIRGYALGGAGFRVSVDGGATWEPAAVPTYLQTLSAPDEQTVWAVASCFTSAGCQPAVYVSTDGARSWAARTTPFPNPEHIKALDERRAWIWSAGSGLWRTDDGGMTWLLLEPLAGLDFLRAMALDYTFVDARHGWTASCPENCGNTFRVTGDGGATWQHRPLPAAYAQVEFFLDPLTGWATTTVASDGPCCTTLWMTDDGGQTWSALGQSAFKVDRVTFIDELRGWATTFPSADESAILSTADGGRTWTLEQTVDGTFDGRSLAVTGSRLWAHTFIPGGRTSLYRRDIVPAPSRVEPPDTGFGPLASADPNMLRSAALIVFLLGLATMTLAMHLNRH